MIEIPDDMVERAIEAGAYFSSAESRKHFRTILQAALNKRVGEADRRKVYDEEKSDFLARRHSMTGRRSTDVVEYDDLPIATEPDIPLSNGMRTAGQTVAIQWRIQGRHGVSDLWCMVAEIYRAMESKRREEEGPPLGAERVHIRKGEMPPPGYPFAHSPRRSTDGIGGTDGA